MLYLELHWLVDWWWLEWLIEQIFQGQYSLESIVLCLPKMTNYILNIGFVVKGSDVENATSYYGFHSEMIKTNSLLDAPSNTFSCLSIEHLFQSS